MAKEKKRLPQVLAVIATSVMAARDIVVSLLQQILGDAASDEYAVTSVDASETGPEELRPHLTGRSLLAEDRVVVVSSAEAWTAAQQREILPMLRALPPGLSVILTVVGEQAERSQPFQADLTTFLKSHGHIERHRKLAARDAQPWVGSAAQRLGVQMDDAAAAELVDRVGPDEDRLASEMEKLATYAGDSGRITLEAVRELVPRSLEASVFVLIDALSSGDVRKAYQLLAEFLPPSGQDEAVAHLLYMLARHFRLLWQTLALQRAGYRLEGLEEVPEELVGKLPAEPNVVASVGGRNWMARKLSQQAQRHTEATVIRSLREIYVADLTLKGILERRLPSDAVAELLVSQLGTLRARGGGRE